LLSPNSLTAGDSTTHREALEAMAKALIGCEPANADEIAELFGYVPQWRSGPVEGPDPRMRSPEQLLVV